MTASKKAARYGSRAEKKAADRYNLELEGNHCSWHDAKRADGTPVEIKAAAVERSTTIVFVRQTGSTCSWPTSREGRVSLSQT
jgi:hypothetical protein